MPKKVKIGNSVLCEYVAMGSNNKHVLVNVFSGDVIVREMPADLRLGIYVEIHRSGATETETFTFEISLDNDRRVAGEFEMLGGTPVGVISIQQFPLRVSAPSTLTATDNSPGYAKTIALSKKIYIGSLDGDAT